MKKFMALLLACVAILSVCVVPSFAATKADLLAEAAKSPIYHYVKAAVENAARTVEITDEQAAQLLPLIQKANAIISEDKGSSPTLKGDVKAYTDAQNAEISAILAEACDILGFTYTVTLKPKAQQTHKNDTVYKVFDQKGNVVFMYDGDQVTDTSAAPAADHTAWIVAGVAVATLSLAAVAFVVARKKVRA